MKVLQQTNCILCGNNQVISLYSFGVTEIVKCSKCGLVYKISNVSKQDLLNFYSNIYYNCEQQKRVNLAKLKIYLKTIEMLVNRFKPKKKCCNLLDIGCADGFFLVLANTYGIEISKEAVKTAKRQVKGKTVIYDKPLKELNFPNGFFDIVTLWDVLDHLGDPLSELKEIYRILKLDGIIICRVRNCLTHLFILKLTRVFPQLSKLISQPSVFHEYSFNAHTLKMIITKAGFKEVKIFNSLLTTGDPYNQSLFSDTVLNIFKISYQLIAEIVNLLTFKTLFISPSIILYAKK